MNALVLLTCFIPSGLILSLGDSIPDAVSAKNSIAITPSYLYCLYQNPRWTELPPWPDHPVLERYKPVSTPGMRLEAAFQHTCTENLVIRYGYALSKRYEQNIHADNMQNANGSQLRYDQESILGLSTFFRICYHWNRLLVLTGLDCPIGEYTCYREIFQDQSNYSGNHEFREGTFYLSEHLEYQPLKRVPVCLSLGIFLSPRFFENLSSPVSGYNALLNIGATWQLQRRNPRNS